MAIAGATTSRSAWFAQCSVRPITESPAQGFCFLGCKRRGLRGNRMATLYERRAEAAPRVDSRGRSRSASRPRMRRRCLEPNGRPVDPKASAPSGALNVLLPDERVDVCRNGPAVARRAEELPPGEEGKPASFRLRDGGLKRACLVLALRRGGFTSVKLALRSSASCEPIRQFRVSSYQPSCPTLAGCSVKRRPLRVLSCTAENACSRACVRSSPCI
jgi:hypothetical protein